MWNLTKTGAVLSALRLIDRNVDPEAILDRADRLGIRLPIACERVMAASLGGPIGWAWTVTDLAAFRIAVDQILTGPKHVDHTDNPARRLNTPTGRRTQTTASTPRASAAGKAA